jgi:hypothetical protein
MTPISPLRTVPVEASSSSSEATAALLRRSVGASATDAMFTLISDRLASCTAVLDGEDRAQAAVVQTRPLSPERHRCCLLGLVDSSAEGSHRAKLLDAAARKAAALGALCLSLEKGRTQDASGRFPPPWALESGFHVTLEDPARWERSIQ